MNVITAFLVAVAAGVACHYIIKWLDGDDKDNKQPSEYFVTVKRKEESPNCTLLRFGDFILFHMNLLLLLSNDIIAYANFNFNIQKFYFVLKLFVSYCSLPTMSLFTKTALFSIFF